MIETKNIVRFEKKDRSTFAYWFAHWCAYQMTALNMKCWKFKYLFHDIEKPWLKLFFNYKTVQKIHNKYNSHHLISTLCGYTGDWEAMIVDWECSRFTKQNSPLNAAEQYNKEFTDLETFFMTYHTNDNKTAEYIKEYTLDLDIYSCACIIKNAYIQLHKTLEKLDIPHFYRENYLQEYFDIVKRNEQTCSL